MSRRFFVPGRATVVQRMSRRPFLRGAGAAALALPFYRLLGRDSQALEQQPGRARRVIFFYFPDGVAGRSQNGEPSLWHATGSETNFQLAAQTEPLAPWKNDCVFFNGLSLGPTDNGSHPGGAKKLLTAVDGGNGMSIDQYLAGTVGADAPFRHVYLGAMANQNNASGDMRISYPSAGNTIAPQDSPLQAFESLFGSPPPAGTGTGSGSGTDTGDGGISAEERRRRRLSVIDASLADLDALRCRLGSVERSRLDFHLEALREVELRVEASAGGSEEKPGRGGSGESGPTCSDPQIDVDGITNESLYHAEVFPKILRAQTDLMVQAMACGLTRVGVIQASHHTSELIMSRFPGTEMYDPAYDMRSHQASHYGPAHDPTKREFRDFVAQRKWFVSQFAYLLQQLDARPEDDGTMLDHSVVVLCTEVCDGNTHQHDDVPFVLAGGAGGRISTGRLLQYGYRRHGDLLCGIAQAMGANVQGWGTDSGGPLPGLLS